jgi:hypothetical protein
MLPTRTYRASSSSPPPSGRYRPPSQACLTTPPTFGHAHGACSPQARARDSVRDSVRVRVSLGLGLAARRRVCAVTCARVCACACASYVCRPWVRWQRACSVCVRAADLQCACSSRHARVRACTCTRTCHMAHVSAYASSTALRRAAQPVAYGRRDELPARRRGARLRGAG